MVLGYLNLKTYFWINNWQAQVLSPIQNGTVYHVPGPGEHYQRYVLRVWVILVSWYKYKDRRSSKFASNP